MFIILSKRYKKIKIKRRRFDRRLFQKYLKKLPFEACSDFYTTVNRTSIETKRSSEDIEEVLRFKLLSELYK